MLEIRCLPRWSMRMLPLIPPPHVLLRNAPRGWGVDTRKYRFIHHWLASWVFRVRIGTLRDRFSSSLRTVSWACQREDFCPLFWGWPLLIRSVSASLRGVRGVSLMVLLHSFAIYSSHMTGSSPLPIEPCVSLPMAQRTSLQETLGANWLIWASVQLLMNPVLLFYPTALWAALTDVTPMPSLIRYYEGS